MKKYLLRLLLPLLLSFVLTGCYFSFHSAQYNAASNFLKTFREDKKFSELDASWVLSWSGYEHKLLAVNVNKEIWFVNSDDIVIRFDGWQIIEVSNLLPARQNVSLEMANSNLLLRARDKDLTSYSCSGWVTQKKAHEDGYTYIQKCSGDNSFENRIEIDSKEGITELSFWIHPNYPPIRLKRILLS